MKDDRGVIWRDRKDGTGAGLSHQVCGELLGEIQYGVTLGRTPKDDVEFYKIDGGRYTSRRLVEIHLLTKHYCPGPRPEDRR